MIDILRSFIRAKRTSNWELHLRTLTEMPPYLAAAGHNLYVKCARLYLQEMASLPNDHPDVHEKFMSGYHSVKRSDRFWGGLSTDLISSDEKRKDERCTDERKGNQRASTTSLAFIYGNLRRDKQSHAVPFRC